MFFQKSPSQSCKSILNVKCPYCFQEGTITLSLDMIKEKQETFLVSYRGGRHRIYVPEGIICPHSFVIYTDNNLEVRSSCQIDYHVKDYIHTRESCKNKKRATKSKHKTMKIVEEKRIIQNFFKEFPKQYSKKLFYFLLRGCILDFKIYIVCNCPKASLKKDFREFIKRYNLVMNEKKLVIFEEEDDSLLNERVFNLEKHSIVLFLKTKSVFMTEYLDIMSFEYEKYLEKKFAKVRDFLTLRLMIENEREKIKRIYNFLLLQYPMIQSYANENEHHDKIRTLTKFLKTLLQDKTDPNNFPKIPPISLRTFIKYLLSYNVIEI